MVVGGIGVGVAVETIGVRVGTDSQQAEMMNAPIITMTRIDAIIFSFVDCFNSVVSPKYSIEP